MPLSWTGVVGSGVVHGGAMALALAIGVLGAPIICVFPVPILDEGRALTFDAPLSATLDMFGPVATGAGTDRLAVMPPETCAPGVRSDTPPRLLKGPTLDSRFLRTVQAVMCVRVEADGSVGRVSLRDAGRFGRRSRADLRNAAYGLRFAPATRDGRPVSAEVELRTVAGAVIGPAGEV